MPKSSSCLPSTPLAKKLGLVPAKSQPCNVALLGGPLDFFDLLSDIPATVRFASQIGPETTLALCFLRTRRELEDTLDLMVARLPRPASFWIARPKQHLKPEINENHVRNAGLERGFVDYKICSISDDWSGVKFTRRRSPAP